MYGALLASRSGLDELDAALATEAHEADVLDLFACWAHELLLRGVVLGGPRIDMLAVELVTSRHPLAHLPMHRLSLERGAQFRQPTYHANGSSAAGASSAPERPPLSPRVPVPFFVEATNPTDDRIAATFESHRTVSNGKSEHRVFELDPPLVGPADPALIAALPLACLEGGSPIATSVIARTADEVFCDLLALATLGGDYNSAWSAAYGRRDAWRSLGGLAGAPVDAPLFEIEALAQTTHWTTFASDSPWFYDIISDYGVAAVSADGSSIRILAGTDTD